MSKTQLNATSQQRIVVIQIINVQCVQSVRTPNVSERAEVVKPKPAPIRSTFGAVLRRVFADMLLAAL
ncbi:MAG: hypothetical protein Kow0096_22350 [Thiohalomonadaceae bacterium]